MAQSRYKAEKGRGRYLLSASPYDGIIRECIERIASLQGRRGEFASVTLQTPPVRRRTVFFTALTLSVLHCAGRSFMLERSLRKKIRTIQKKGVQFLLAERSRAGSWNYFARRMHGAHYPDDLDDSALALCAISECAPLSGAMLTETMRLLTTYETKRGGPYRTWCVPRDCVGFTDDGDIAVNANIRTMLRAFRVDLPQLNAFLKSALKQGVPRSPYYRGTIPVLYCISRGAHAKQEKALVLHRAAMQRETVHTALEQAMMISLTHHCGRSVSMASLVMPESEEHATVPLIVERKTGKVIEWGACAALTYACIAEASQHILESRHEIHRREFMQNVLRTASQEWRNNRAIHTILKKVPAEQERERIITMPFEIMSALPKGGVNMHTTAVRLALALWYGWTAYTIFDAITDEGREGNLLYAATMLMRRSFALYKQTEKSTHGLIGMTEDAFNVMDTENHRELQSKWSGVAWKKSWGYALAARMLFAHGVPHAKKDEHDALRRFWKHYLTARQLHDDAHDWSDDLRRGHRNEAARMVFTAHELQSFTKDKAKLGKKFWEKGIDAIVARIDREVKCARSALVRLGHSMRIESLERMVSALSESAHRALYERDVIHELKSVRRNGRVRLHSRA